MMKRLSTFGWPDLLKGALFLVLGISMICAPQLALSGLVMALGAMIFLWGILNLILYAKRRKYTDFEGYTSPLKGLVCILAGILLLLNPMFGRRMLSSVCAILFIAQFLSRLTRFGFIKEMMGRAATALLLCLNILGLLFGIVMLFNPMLFTLSLGFLVGGSLLVFGASSIVEAFSNTGRADQPVC